MASQTRTPEEIQAEMAELKDSGKKNPAKVGALKNELIDSLTEAVAADPSLRPTTTGTITNSPVDPTTDRRWALATALVCAYFEKNRENTQYLAGLVRQFDAFFDSAEAMVESGGREALIAKTKEAEDRAKELTENLDLARGRIRELEEFNRNLSQRMVANGVPV